ncbi:uncharacterized protein LOC117326411 [Pecten maximus]|uniref:uncharacterized protein LOC117326411 n=1 Tax=Pecten maximus TaxID=6579 RepID=UPI001458EFF0|nr:uncharacterized protein LOC117326411 [Pecten maximus]
MFCNALYSVRISKLHNFSVSGITSRKASLSWQLPEYLLLDVFIIDFAINYSSRWDSAPGQLMYSNKSRMRTELGGLLPYTNYHVTIRGKGRMVADNRSWSPMETLSFRTDKDAPSAAPKSTVGGYFLPRRLINNTEVNCALQIYVKPLGRRKRNGNISELYYRVSIQGEQNQLLVARPFTTITLSDKDCWNDGPYAVVIQACIEERLCSTKRTVVNIPLFHPDNQFPYATDVIAEGFGDASVRVSWFIESQFRTRIEGVTIFWCRGNKGLRTCKSDLSWKKLAGDVTETWLNLTKFNYHDWMFAVSLTTHNGESGGTVFEECQFRYFITEHEDTSQRNSDTPFESVKPTFNLLSRDYDAKLIDVLSLTFRYCDAQFLYRKPEQYEVFYKAITEATDEHCTDGAQSFNMTATLRVQEIVLPDLDPMSPYAVCMRIRTSMGVSELSDVKWRKPLIDPDTDSGQLAAIISKTLATLIVLAVLVVVIWRVCQRYKAMDVNVQVPTIDKSEDYIGEMELLVNDSDSGIEVKGNATHATDSKKSIVMTRRTLPMPPHLQSSTRASTDSDVMRSSIESQAIDSCKGNIFTARTDGEIVELPPSPMCKVDRCNYQSNDRTFSTGEFSSIPQVGYIENSCKDSSSGSGHQLANNITPSLRHYCHWDILARSSNDTDYSRLASLTTEINDGERIQVPTEEYGISTAEKSSDISVPTEEYGISTAGKSSDISVPTEEYGISTAGKSSGIKVPTEENGISTAGISSGIKVPTEEYGISTAGKSSGIKVPTEENGISTAGKSSGIKVPTEEYGISTAGKSSGIKVPTEEYGIGTVGKCCGISVPTEEYGISTTGKSSDNSVPTEEYGISTAGKSSGNSVPTEEYGISTAGTYPDVPYRQIENGLRSISHARSQSQLDSSTTELSVTPEYNSLSCPCVSYILQPDMSLIWDASGTTAGADRIPLENQLGSGMTCDNDFNDRINDDEQ